MDVKFNADAAEKLIDSMDQYCLKIHAAAVDSLDILNYSDKWCDSRKDIFQRNINEVCEDLQKALILESEYMKIFIEKVNELRG